MRWLFERLRGDGHEPPRPAPYTSAAALHAAIEGATISRRSADDDGERIMVIANSLGGAFIYDRGEVERRIQKYFPGLAEGEAQIAARFLEDRVRAHLQPMQDKERRAKSWVHGWRDGY